MFLRFIPDGLILTRTVFTGVPAPHANENGRPDRLPGGRFKKNYSLIQRLRLTFAAELGQAQIPYDGTQQNHGTRFRLRGYRNSCIGNELLPPATMTSQPAPQMYPLVTAACACRK